MRTQKRTWHRRGGRGISNLGQGCFCGTAAVEIRMQQVELQCHRTGNRHEQGELGAGKLVLPPPSRLSHDAQCVQKNTCPFGKNQQQKCDQQWQPTLKATDFRCGTHKEPDRGPRSYRWGRRGLAAMQLQPQHWLLSGHVHPDHAIFREAIHLDFLKREIS